MDWTAIAVISGFLANAVMIGIAFGGLRQQVRDLKDNLNKTDQRVIDDRRNADSARADDRRDTEVRIETASHNVLPECQSTFLNLSGGISELKGKVDTLIKLVVNGKQ